MSRLGEIWRRMGMLLRRERFDHELDEEMRLHREMKEGELMADGVNQEEAAYAARRVFGNTTVFSERGREAWGWRWLEELPQDVRFGVRMLRKSPGFTIACVLSLALGVGANTAMFSIVNAWLLRPLPLKNPQELVSVWRTRLLAPDQPAFFNLYHDYLVWSSQNRAFQSLAATFEQRYALTGAGEPAQVQGAVASWNFFQTVGATPELGRLFEAEDARRESSCVISHALWVRQFHSASDIASRAIRLNRKLYRVLGVLPANFSLRVLDRPFDTDLWTVITDSNTGYTADAPLPVAVIGRLRDGVAIAQAEADISALQTELNRQFSDEPENSGIVVANLQRDNTRTIRGSLLLLFGAVSVLLIIASMNTGSLILGRNTQRAKEFAVRVALGCGTRRLLRQLSAELLTIFVFGGAVGLLIALGVLRTFVAWSPFGVLPPGGVSLDRTVLAATAGIVCLAALMFGSLPALRALHVPEQDAVRTANPRTISPREQLRWRSLFVAMEISLSVVLLVSAGLLIATFVKIDSEPLGFQTRDVHVGDVALPVAVYPTNAERTRFCAKLLEKLHEIPGVRAAGIARTWPFNVDGLTPLETEKRQGLPMQQLPQAATLEVSPGYFDALGVALLRGRAFNNYDAPDSLPVAVINDQMAGTYFDREDPVGKRIRLRYIDQPTPTEPWLTIVGVVGSTRSVRYNQVRWDNYPAVYTSFFQRAIASGDDPGSAQTVYLYIQRLDIQGASPLDGSLIASSVHDIDPDLPFGSLRTTGEIVRALRSQPRARGIFLGSFGALTLLMSAIGVGGLMSQMVEQRRRDIGIRMALGATPSDVRHLVVGQALKLAFYGIAGGLLAAAAVTRVLRSFLFGISTLDPATFVAAIILLFTVALLAAYLPTRRAGRLDPILILRHE